MRQSFLFKLVGFVILAGAFLLSAQTQPSSEQPPAASTSESDLSDQIATLRAQVARLQAQLDQQKKSGERTQTNPMAGMQNQAGMGMDEGEMGGMSSSSPMTDDMDDSQEMSGMGSMPQSGSSSSGMQGMEMMGSMGGNSNSSKGGMGMDMMGPGMGMDKMMGGMMSNPKRRPNSPMKMSPSAQPGNPGASHLYHIGSTGFFLNHAKHLNLTADQRTRLNLMKEKATLEQASMQRRVDDAEQELFTLTSADQPHQTKIATQVRQIEKLRSDQRLAFIRSIGEASAVLTDQQKQTLVGKPMRGM